METPTFTIDTSKTVEQRLTDNTVDDILPARYLQKNSNGEVLETPEALFDRVAENVAEVNSNHLAGPSEQAIKQRFKTAMKELRFIPNSPTLMNAGTSLNQLSACFVLEPGDDMRDIKETDTEAAMIFKSGGGVGYAFHHLRACGAFIRTTGGHSSGPVSMMKMFDETCQQVKQGGKRRGAQMGIMKVTHPDIGRFILCKRDEGDLDNFNISVGVTDEFVRAVENGESFVLKDPQTDLEDPFQTITHTAQFYDPSYQDNPASSFAEGSGEVVTENLWRDYADSITVRVDGVEIPLREKWEEKISVSAGDTLELPAEFLWDLMVDGAHRNGEPGIFHFDEANNDNSFPRGETDYDIEATNPCAEQPLAEYEACNLGHVNLSLMLDEQAPTYEEWAATHDADVVAYVQEALDVSLLCETVQTGTRFLDNVVTKSDFPLEEIESRVSNLRKIGLGIMGLAQMLYQMGVAYDTEVGRDISAAVMKLVDRSATTTSNMLAKERGCFPAWEESKYANPEEHPEWFEKHVGKNPYQTEEYQMRNHKVTTIAPTGTTSMIGDTSGGCEPVYSVAYYKNVGDDIQGDDFLVEFDSYFVRALQANEITVSVVKAEAERQMERNEFDGVTGLESVPDDFGEVFVTTEEISSQDHALMQRRLQEHVDSGISKTINMPAEATRDDVDRAYRLALSEDEPGARAKGLTVYRNNSRDEQVKSTEKDMESAESDETEMCPECNEGELKQQEGCALCPECGFSPCS